MSFCVYILECVDGSYYTGCTNDIKRRVKQHNSHKSGARYTKIRRPTVLVYSEQFTTLLEARRKEIEIKSWTKSKKEKLINKNSAKLQRK